MKIPLPIDAYIPQVVDCLKKANELILKASPGSGKTTRVPPSLLSSSSEILVLEPRRLAAKFSALRVAEELGEKIGVRVGYHFRLEKRVSKDTRLTFLTEGMLIRKALLDPTLKNVSVVILDEFHERHLHSDLSLGYLKHLQNTSRPDLKIVLLSATLDTEKLKAYLNNAAVLEVEAPRFSIETRYYCPKENSLEEKMVSAVRTALGEEKYRGHVLCFLPGMREILRTKDLLSSKWKGPIFVLHGEVSKEDQEVALKATREQKVILSTNIAESSLTIPGVTTVIDSGLERVGSVSPWTGLSVLSTKKISKASAIQRAGRAGRERDGLCIRLYSEYEFETSIPYNTPEIRRSDLAQSLLELSALGITDFTNFPWFEPPPEVQFNGSLSLLENLGALKDGRITKLGESLASLPLHPRIGKLLIEANDLGCLNEGARLAALLTEGELGDTDTLQALKRAPSFRTKNLEERLFEYFPETKKKSEENLPLAILRAFPDRVAKLKGRGQKNNKFRELLLCTGGTILVEDGALLSKDEYFTVLDAQESRGNTYARGLVAIDEASLLDLPGALLQESKQLSWDDGKKVFKIDFSKGFYGDSIFEVRQ